MQGVKMRDAIVNEGADQFYEMDARTFFAKTRLMEMGVSPRIASRIDTIIRKGKRSYRRREPNKWIPFGTMREFLREFSSFDNLMSIEKIGETSVNEILRILNESGFDLKKTS